MSNKNNNAEFIANCKIYMFVEYLTLNELSWNKDNIRLIAFIFSLITNNKYDRRTFYERGL